MSRHGLQKSVLSKLSKQYIASRANKLNNKKRKQEREPWDRRLKKRGRKKERLYFLKPKKRGKKKMLCEVDSLTAPPPQIFQIVESLGATN